MEQKIIAIKVTAELAQELLNYLAGKPYVEVVGLIAGIQKSEQIYEIEEK